MKCFFFRLSPYRLDSLSTGDDDECHQDFIPSWQLSNVVFEDGCISIS